MQYRIATLSGEPRFDSLGVLKLRCTASVPVEERMFAQAQLGRNAEFFFVRIWSFETAPNLEARLSCTLCHNDHRLTLSATRAKEVSLVLDEALLPDRLTAYQISGEDLQGEYWGVVMMLPMETLLDALKLSSQEQSAVLLGNIMREHPACSSAVPLEEQLELLLSI